MSGGGWKKQNRINGDKGLLSKNKTIVKNYHYLLLFIFFISCVLCIRYYRNTAPISSEGAISEYDKDGSKSITADFESNSKSPLPSFFENRCRAGNIRFQVVSTIVPPPQIPNAFHAETEGPWPKVVGKLESRYGVVPVYDSGDPEFKKPPPSITLIGKFLYFGANVKEIEALKLLSDGDAVQRSQALDFFGNTNSHVVPLFLALQERDEDAQIRIEATQRLQSFDSTRVIEATISALGDSDEAVQSAARSSLVWIGNERVLQAVRIAVNSPNPRISEMARSILENNLEH